MTRLLWSVLFNAAVACSVLIQLVGGDDVPMDVCLSAMSGADLDGNGGINSGDEYTELIRLLGERKCYASPGAPTGQQAYIFWTLVCGPLFTTTSCVAGDEIPLSAADDIQLQACDIVDGQIFGSCPPSPAPIPTTPLPTTPFPTLQPVPVVRESTFPPTSPAPTTAQPTTNTPTRVPTISPTRTATDAPTLHPVSTQPVAPIAPDLTVENCQTDVATADVDSSGRVTYEEYGLFLLLLGQRVCFTPDANSEVAKNGTFWQFKCLSNNDCPNAESIDMSVFTSHPVELRKFCLRAYNLALNAPLCSNTNGGGSGGGSGTTTTAAPTPQPTTSPTRRPTTTTAAPATSPPSLQPPAAPTQTTSSPVATGGGGGGTTTPQPATGGGVGGDDMQARDGGSAAVVGPTIIRRSSRRSIAALVALVAGFLLATT